MSPKREVRERFHMAGATLGVASAVTFLMAFIILLLNYSSNISPPIYRLLVAAGFALLGLAVAANYLSQINVR